MRCVAPSWLCHGAPGSRTPVFSLDLQCDAAGGRLATAGQDCTVRIWDTAALDRCLHAEEADPAAGPPAPAQGAVQGAPEGRLGGARPAGPEGALLSVVRAHAKSVSCVRWAPSGRLLASGGDDWCVLLYERGVGRGGFGGREDWRTCASLRRHTSDITDLAWAPDGTRLASGSVDNTVMIWELWESGWRLIRRLEGHRGIVKGVAWDPMGRYVASQGSDRAVVIWRTADWSRESVLTEPFEKAVLQQNEFQFFLRLSWSPCGTQLIATNAYNPPKHVAPMFSRESNFREHVDLIGHSAPVVCTRFSPRLYTRANYPPGSSDPAAAANLADEHVETTNKHNNPQNTNAQSTTNFPDHAVANGIVPLHHAAPPEPTDANAAVTRQNATNQLDALNQSRAQFTTPASNPHQANLANPTKPGGPDSGANGPAPAPGRRRPAGGGGGADGAVEDVPAYTCVAVGSKDNGASIWQAGSSGPFFSLANMFSQDVIDLAWGSSGLTVAAASTDGSVMYLRFAEKELGFVLSHQDAQRIFDKTRRSFSAGVAGSLLPESVAQLDIEAGLQPDEQLRVRQTQQQQQQQQRPEALQPQRQSPLPRQPRRIQPQALGTGHPPNGAFAPVKSVASAPADARQSQSMPRVANASSFPNSSSLPSSANNTPIVILAAQRETRGKGGKRRIIPQALDTTTMAPSSSLPHADTPPFKVRRVDPQAVGGALRASDVEPIDVDAQPDGDVARQRETNALLVRVEDTGLAPSSAPKGEGLSVGSVVGLNTTLLAEPERGKRARVIQSGTPPVMVEILVREGSVVCSKGGKVLWREYYEGASQVAGLGGKFVAIATKDGLLGLHSAKSGRKLCPPIALDSSPHLMHAQVIEREEEELWYLLVVSRSALCSVYDVKHLKLTCARSAAMLLAKPVELPPTPEKSRTPKSPAATGSPTAPRRLKGPLTEDPQTLTTRIYRDISAGQVSPAGEPILMLSDGQSFCYSRNLHSWLLVASAAPTNSEYRRTLPTSAGPLRTLQARAGTARKARPLPGGDLRRAASDSLAHLETLIGAAEALGSAAEYKYYLAAYCTRLAAAVEEEVEGVRARVREVCEMLLEPGRVVGLDKRALLRKVALPVLAKNRVLQRVVAEFAECLEEMERREKEKGRVEIESVRVL